MYFTEFIGTSVRESFPATLETELPAVYLDVLLTGQTGEVPSIPYGDENIPKSEFALKVFAIERLAFVTKISLHLPPTGPRHESR